MKKLIYLIVVIGVLALIVAGCGLLTVPPSEESNTGSLTKGATIYVDDDWQIGLPPYAEDTDGDNYFATIQAAITAATIGETIIVAPGTFYEVGQIVIDKNLVIIGADKSMTIIKPNHDTTVAGYFQSDAWIYVPSGVTFALSEVTLDGTDLIGTPRIIRHAIQSRGELTVEDCIIKNIKTNNIYYGRGIVLLAGTSNTIARCEFIDIQRIGIHIRGNVEPTNPIAHIEDCTYVGKGDGDWLDYGIEFGGGGSGTVDGCDISDCTGVALSDGSTSAGILATDYWGTGTVVTVENSILTGNSEGIHVGYALGDATVLIAHSNNIIGNIVYGICNVGIVEVDATRNWWGSPTGPNRELPNGKWVGKGDKVGSNIDYKPWSPQPVEFCNDLSLTCTTIQDGTLLTSDGRVITTGYDEWGYDYQAHIFNGGYCDAYRDAAWCQPYKDTQLIMKWDDAWLSNMDCDGDGLLDRHYGFDSYIGSGAWLTNHMWGEYEVVENGEICKWNYFVKIVAAPADAYVDGGYWYNAGGTEIGPVIWGAFAIVQEVENDACAGLHGLQYLSPAGPGFGQYGPE